MTMTMLHKKISVRQPFFKQSGLDHCARISDLACKEIFGSHAPSSLICLFSGEGATVISNIKFQWNNHMTVIVYVSLSYSRARELGESFVQANYFKSDQYL